MGKTILELFRSRNESNGEVAEKKYAPRNSKDIGIQTNSFLINNSAVYAINLARRNFGQRIGETFLEEDGILGIGGVGIRPLYTLSTPVLHGTDLLRLETQRTDQTEAMKNSARGAGIDVPGGGLLGGGIQTLKKAATPALKKLGVTSDINPTVVYTDSELKNTKNISETPTILSKFKGDSAGNLLGKALSQPATPGQLVKNVAGAAVSGIKTKVRGAIFGEKSTTGFSNATGSLTGRTINYGSDDTIGDGDVPEKPEITENGAFDAGGRRYSRFFKRIVPNIDEFGGGFSGIGLKTSDGFKDVINISSNENGIVKQIGTGVIIPHITTRVNNEPEVGPNSPAGDVKKLGFYSTLTNNNRNGETKNISNNSLSVRRGMQNGADIINQSGVIDATNKQRTDGGDALKPTKAESNLGWHYDFIPLKINRLSDSKTIYFRSTITGLSETFSPSWDSAKFIGNPFNYYTYNGIERSVSFNIKVYALNGREMISMWDKLKFLAELTYPAGYTNTSAVIPPFIKFTLGSFYDKKVGFIESLSYTVDENTPWEVGLNNVRPVSEMNLEDSREYFFGDVNNESVEGKLRTGDTPLDNYRLPMIVDVQMTVKFVESRINTTNATLYDFGGPGSA
jgi:hypothetical protein